MVSTVSKIQPTDPIYQVTDQYKPDKENEWTYPPERDGWVLAHNSLRGEMRLMREALLAMKARDKLLTAWELKALTIAAEGHLEHIHCHHRNEDEILAPECRTRFKYPEKVSEFEAVVSEKQRFSHFLFLFLTVIWCPILQSTKPTTSLW